MLACNFSRYICRVYISLEAFVMKLALIKFLVGGLAVTLSYIISVIFTRARKCLLLHYLQYS